MSCTVEFDLSSVRASVERICGKTLELTVDMGTELAKDGAQYARDHHAYTDRTRKLTESIRSTPCVGGDRDMHAYVIAGGAEAPYARIIEEGSKPHTITGNPFLVFPGKSGDIVFARSVEHPGTRPYGFMGQAYFSMERRIPLHFERIVTELRAL